MAVNLEYYRTFYQVATLKSMGKAAEAMYLTPPTVTKAIQSLERQIGCQLFRRNSKGVVLTQAGELLLARVRLGLSQFDAGERDVQMFNSLEGGSIRIGMSEAVASYFTMPSVFGAFCQRYPKIRLKVKHLPASEIEDAIQTNDIDFAVMGITEESKFDGMASLRLYNSDNVPVVGRQYAHLSGRSITLHALNKIPLIFVEAGYSIRQHYEALYKSVGLDFSPMIEMPTLDMQLKAVTLGLGYSFVPAPYIQGHVKNGEIFLLELKEEPVFRRNVCLLTREDIPLSRAAQALVDVLLRAAKDFGRF